MEVVYQLRDNIVSTILNPLLLLMFAGALLLFVWGIVEFMWGLSTETADKNRGKKNIIYGLAGMFIMVVAWSILGLIGSTICPSGLFGCNRL